MKNKKEVMLYEYVFSLTEKKLYKVEQPCRETEKMYIRIKPEKPLEIKDAFIENTAIRRYVFNYSTCAGRIAKTELNKVIGNVVVSLDPNDDERVMQLFEKDYKENLEYARESYQKACNRYDEFNRAWANIIEENTIKTPADMYQRVKDEYFKYDTELNSLFFDFRVRMSKKDILETYAELQHDINGDFVGRFENNKEQDELIPHTPDWDEVYEGNCKDFLESFNGSDEFRRYNDEERLDFVWQNEEDQI